MAIGVVLILSNQARLGATVSWLEFTPCLKTPDREELLLEKRYLGRGQLSGKDSLSEQICGRSQSAWLSIGAVDSTAMRDAA